MASIREQRLFSQLRVKLENAGDLLQINTKSLVIVCCVIQRRRSTLLQSDDRLSREEIDRLTEPLVHDPTIFGGQHEID